MSLPRLAPWLLALATACAPQIVVRRDVPPRVMLEARTVSVQAKPFTGDVAVDVLRTVADPFGTASRLTLYTPEAQRCVEQGLTNSGLFQIVAGCQGPCPQADLTVWVHVSDSKTQLSKEEVKEDSKTKQKTVKRTYLGSADLQVAVEDRARVFVYQHQYGGSATGEDQPPLVRRAVERACGHFLADVQPQTVSDTFVLAKEGPLKNAGELAAKGELAEAERQTRAFLAGNPNHAEAYFHLGAFLTAQGNLEAAIQAFDQAAALKPGFGQVAADARQRWQDRETLRAFLERRGVSRAQ